MAPSRLVALAKEIESNTTKLDEYFTKNNLPPPSFEEDTPLMYQFPPEIAAAQEALSAAIDELWWLNQGPMQTIVAKSVCPLMKSSLYLDRVLTMLVCYVGRSQDDSQIQYSQPRPL
jgi:hypothetical protein